MFSILNNQIEMPKTKFEKYRIPVDDCDTPEKLIGWVHKLCGYSWAKTSSIKEFIDTATKYRYLDLLITDTESYDIDKCDTPEKLIGWVYKLCADNSIKTDTIEDTIETAVRDHNVNISWM